MTAYINPEPVHVTVPLASVHMYLIALFNPTHVSTFIVSISEEILFVEKSHVHAEHGVRRAHHARVMHVPLRVRDFRLI